MRFSVVDGRGRPVRTAGLGSWLERWAPRAARGPVGIALVGDATIRRLNRQFRGQDRATDVLSFVETQDIAIALGVARRQARQHGHDLSTELRILALHGVLHLLGYDHERDTGQMHQVEDRLRRRAGLPAGLIRRAR